VVRVVRFVADGAVVAADSTEPFAVSWATPPVGWHLLRAEAQDDSGAVRVSAAVRVLVEPLPGVPMAVSNPGFESPVLADGVVADGTADHGGWQFTGTPATYLGVFNPPAGSYPGAGGDGTPSGADGANVAYLFNDGGAADSAIAVQTLGDSLEAGGEYTLRVAIGRFLPDQPYAFSTWGGYRVELLAGDRVIARDVNGALPAAGAFRDALAWVDAATLSPGLVGRPLGIRLALAGSEAPRSTHFDRVRLSRRLPTSAVPPDGRPQALTLRATVSGDRLRCVVSSTVAGAARLALHDVAGRRVRSAVIERVSGSRVVEWEVPRVPGLYFAILRAGDGVATARVVVR
jgi:hypothetical protein